MLGVLFVTGIVAQDGKNRTAVPVKSQKKIISLGTCNTLNSKLIPDAVPVGFTNYDLQTNDGIAKRLINHGDGTFSTVWIQYQGETLPGAPERGSGYNYYDGSSWLYTLLTEPGNNITIEGSQRTGWPAIVALDDGTEYVANHANTAGYFGWTQTIGASNTGWTQKNSDASEPLLWPRAAVSGDTIHIFGVVDYDITYNGQSPAPIYLRSTDGGDTWDGLVQPTGIGSTFFDGIGGDSYAIDANGDVVAFVLFDIMSDCVLFKSTDGGDNWTKKIIADFPVNLYDWEGGVLIDEDTDGIADTCTTVNNADVVIDDNGVVHVGFSTLLIVDDDPGDNAASYFFAYNNGIHYWNDTMDEGYYDGTPTSSSFHELYISDVTEMWIGWTPDLDESGIIGDGITGSGKYGFQGWCGYPSIALDASDNIYISYSATMEGDDYLKLDANPEPQNFKHILVSQKIGSTWEDPIDVTSVDGTNAENIYCTLAKNADTHLYMQYQWDNEPGLNINTNGDGDAATYNYILFKAIPLPISVSEVKSIENNIAVMVYPNPANDIINVNANNIKYIEVYNILGTGIMLIKDNFDNIDVSTLSSGSYVFKVTTDEGVAVKKVQIN